MKRLYILGNGFDLYMGMKTSYNNFFENGGYSSIKKEINIKNKIQVLLIKHTENILDLKSEIEKVSEGIFSSIDGKINNLFLLYLVISNNELIYWQNVEKQIKPYIKCAEEALTNITMSIEEERMIEHLSGEEIEMEMEEIKGNYEEIEEILKKLILKKFIRNKCDKNDKNIILRELNKFEKEFGQYIKNLDNPLEVDDLDIVTKKIKNVFNKLQDELKESGINVITFNYTDYLKDYFKVFVNIHGTTENPIFGIDSKEAEENHQYIYFTKTSRVLEANIEKKEIDSPLPDIAYTGEIVFFGHSLAEADYSYFQSIFDYYDIYDNTINLKFLYHDYSVDCKEKEKMHASVMKLINTYGKSLDNKDKGSNLLHKLLLESRIKIVEIK